MAKETTTIKVEIGSKTVDKDGNITFVEGGKSSRGIYAYLDRSVFEAGSDDVCFMSESLLADYEDRYDSLKAEKNIFNSGRIAKKIAELHKTCGFTGKEMKKRFEQYDKFLFILSSEGLI